MGRIAEKQSPLIDVKTEFLQDGGTEDDTYYEEPPCMCAQQIISTLFGTILGYIALLLVPVQVYFPLAFMQGLGITLGLLGTENSSLKNVSSREPLIICGATVIVTYMMLTVVGIIYNGDITLGTLVWTSFLLSNIASLARACTRTPNGRSPLPLRPESDAASPLSGLSTARYDGFTTPERGRLKLKHSGDANDWAEIKTAIKGGAMNV